eukprot:snap_masked-scaffold_30-processed-gene-0.18-mRNA-1 protein AED:1.00 eAED:1.00 QI:0/0/0/0/1/1/2/0/70
MIIPVKIVLRTAKATCLSTPLNLSWFGVAGLTSSIGGCGGKPTTTGDISGTSIASTLSTSSSFLDIYNLF